MERLNLNGSWKVSKLTYGSPIGEILAADFIPEGWLDAVIPEDIHTTLRRAGYIRGHFYGKDVSEEVWIEESDWVYYKEFYVESSMRSSFVELLFEGLDTFCDVYLNGNLIGHYENMHMAFSADVTNKLIYNCRNTLVIRFYSPVKYVEGRDTKELFSTTKTDRLFARKAQMNYSWDFCGRCVTTGIWKGISLNSYTQSHIDSFYVYTKSIDNSSAFLGLEVEINSRIFPQTQQMVSVEISNGRSTVYNYSGLISEFTSLDIEIPDPELWWPRPYGEPFLYNVTIKLLDGSNTVIDKREHRFGIRTIEIIQEKQEDGRSYIFSVNGRRLFIRGANWVPINVIYTSIHEDEYRLLVDYAVEGNLSMLRIWGGGIYEPEILFELCDEKGIMLWQDFMFACGIYPKDTKFHENVYNEAVFNLKRYRNYTCLVMWSGDNENDEAYTWAGKPYDYVNETLNRVTLKAAWQKYDPYRLYIPSSPHSPFEMERGGDNPKSPHQGDMHIYIVSSDPTQINYYRNIKTYRPRFMSEFGFLSLPEKDSYYKYNLLKKAPKIFLKHHRGIVRADYTMEDGKDHDEFIYFIQVYNSLALKYWIEYLRRLKWVCAGSLYWKFNDPIADNEETQSFPTLMSTVDFFKQPKMAFYYSKRAYEDVILVCDDAEKGYDFYLCSELDKDLRGTAEIMHLDFDGDIIKKFTFECNIEKDGASLIGSVPYEYIKVKDILREYILMEFKTKDTHIKNRYYFADIEDMHKLALKHAVIVVNSMYKCGNQIILSLTADSFVPNVRLNILNLRAYYSDNYFDMDAGSEKTVIIRIMDDIFIKEKALYIEAINIDRQIISLGQV